MSHNHPPKPESISEETIVAQATRLVDGVAQAFRDPRVKHFLPQGNEPGPNDALATDPSLPGPEEGSQISFRQDPIGTEVRYEQAGDEGTIQIITARIITMQGPAGKAVPRQCQVKTEIKAAEDPDSSGNVSRLKDEHASWRGVRSDDRITGVRYEYNPTTNTLASTVNMDQIEAAQLLANNMGTLEHVLMPYVPLPEEGASE